MRTRSLTGWGVLGALVLGVIAAAPVAWADLDADLPSPRIMGSLHKLGRGLANIATCPLEIPRMTRIVSGKDGWIAGSTVGAAQGLGRGVLRGLVGVFEVVTFFAEIPPNYEPLMKPEFVWANTEWTGIE